MKKLLYLLSVLMLFPANAQAAEKLPLPNGFGSRMNIVFECCGGMPMALAAAIALILVTSAAAILYYYFTEDRKIEK